jgi:hypothetical protein
MQPDAPKPAPVTSADTGWWSRQTKGTQIAIGVVVLVLAVGAYVRLTGNDDHGATCALSQAGIGLIGAEFAKGERSAEAILATTAAEVAISTQCKPIIKSWIQHPNKPTTIAVKVPGGDTVDQAVTGNEVQATDPSQNCPSTLPPSAYVDCILGL